jgi:NADH:ubiquinone oxidoreductase subunit E
LVDDSLSVLPGRHCRAAAHVANVDLIVAHGYLITFYASRFTSTPVSRFHRVTACRLRPCAI